MKLSSSARGFKLIELMFTIAISSVVGLALYSILYSGLVLGAKNTAINTAHHQARIAMINMIQDIHAAVSLPSLTDSSGNALLVTRPHKRRRHFLPEVVERSAQDNRGRCS